MRRSHQQLKRTGNEKKVGECKHNDAALDEVIIQ